MALTLDSKTKQFEQVFYTGQSSRKPLYFSFAEDRRIAGRHLPESEHSWRRSKRHQLTGLSANANTSTALAAVHDPSTLSATRCQAC